MFGCAGGDACPLVKDLVGNTAIFTENTLGKCPSVNQLLPSFLLNVFTKPVCEAIVGIATAVPVSRDTPPPLGPLQIELVRAQNLN